MDRVQLEMRNIGRFLVAERRWYLSKGRRNLDLTQNDSVKCRAEYRSLAASISKAKVLNRMKQQTGYVRIKMSRQMSEFELQGSVGRRNLTGRCGAVLNRSGSCRKGLYEEDIANRDDA